MRDETDLSGLKLTIDLKRGVEPDKLMQKLFRSTPLQDSFACNFNILIAGMPRVMGVREIIEEWTAWRTECVRRRLFFQKRKKSEKLHLLQGPATDPAGHRQGHPHHPRDGVRGGGRAEPDDRLRHRRGAGGVRGGDQAAQHQQGIHSAPNAGGRRAGRRDRRAGKDARRQKRIRRLIVQELDAVAAKYGTDRRTVIVEDAAELDRSRRRRRPIIRSRSSFPARAISKKITPQSLRMSGEQRFKEGDGLRFSCETTNAAGAARLLRSLPGLQGALCRFLTTARPRCSATICLKARLRRGAERRGRLPARRLQRQPALPCSPTVGRRAWSFPPIGRSQPPQADRRLQRPP